MRLPVGIAADFREDLGLRIALIYALVAGLWILASDWLLGLLFSDPATLTELATLKGWGFVAVTSLMLYGLVRRDLARIKLSEKEVQSHLDHQKILLDVYQKMSAAQVGEIIAFVVDKCVNLTGSAMGFVGLVSADDQRMEAHIWSEKAMDNSPLAKPLNFPLDGAGLWAEPIRQRRMIIVNDCCEANPFTKECPEGPLELSRFMGIPVVDNDRVVAVAGVANKREDYAEADQYNVFLLLESMWDLIKRKRAEEALQRQEKELAAIFESAPFIMVLLDGEKRVRRANALAHKLSGSSVADMEGLLPGEALRCLHALADPRGCGFGPNCERCTVRRTVIDALETRQSHHQIEASLSFHIQGKEESRTFLLSSAFVSVADDPMVLVSLQDITEHKKLEEQLRQAQKMEAIGTLAGGVAHDFNNILGVINGYSEVLLEEGGLESQHRGNVEQILEAGQLAAGLTRQLLAFSRKLVLETKVLSLNTVIEGFERMLHRLLGDEFEVRMLLDPALDLVNADPNQMEQVLLNFCINARDAMPEGGRVTIQTGNLEVDETMAAQHPALVPGRYVKFSVSDTGAGMDAGTLSRIFEPFFTTKGMGRGTGLGLAMVYGIVKQSGGHVTAYSEPGQGSTFCVYLPVAQRLVEDASAERAASKPARGSETILLVEDSAPLCALYGKLLERKGYTVLVAEDGELALKVAEGHPGRIDLLLSDVSLPKLKGPAMAKRLLESRPELRVLLISGFADDAVTEGHAPEGAGFLQKPFSVQTLAQKVREMLEGRG